jgi:hypothetical protein
LLQHAELLISAHSPQQYTAVGEALSAVCGPLAAIATLLGQPAADADSARALLGQVVGHLRELDVAQGGGHTRAADVLALYAATQVGRSRGCFKVMSLFGFTVDSTAFVGNCGAQQAVCLADLAGRNALARVMCVLCAGVVHVHA